MEDLIKHIFKTLEDKTNYEDAYGEIGVTDAIELAFKTFDKVEIDTPKGKLHLSYKENKEREDWIPLDHSNDTHILQDKYETRKTPIIPIYNRSGKFIQYVDCDDQLFKKFHEQGGSDKNNSVSSEDSESLKILRQVYSDVAKNGKITFETSLKVTNFLMNNTK